MARAARVREEPSGATFLREGEPATSFFVIQAGTVTLAQITPEGHLRRLAMTNNLGLDVELPLAFGDAVGRVKDPLKQEGFGILAEIDLQAALREARS